MKRTPGTQYSFTIFALYVELFLSGLRVLEVSCVSYAEVEGGVEMEGKWPSL